MNWEEQLQDIINDPIFDDVKPVAKQISTSDRLISSFEAVNAFFDEHGRLPSSEGSIKEKGLARRFETIICDVDKQNRCLPYDRHGLIKAKETDVNAELSELFNDPIFNISPENESLFTVPEHLKKNVAKADPDFVARRKRCEDFDLYHQQFIDIHKDLKNGSRCIVKFNESHFEEGSVFLVGGVLVLLNKIFDKKVDKNRKVDARTHCVFENGTESNLLLRSLGKAIYLDGYSISESQDNVESYLHKELNVTDQDQESGYIYVLRSKSQNPAIANCKDLYKIGYTKNSVKERIANASSQSTYLFDEVEIVDVWKTYNLNTVYFETMLHHLFDQVQLQVKVYNSAGEVAVPKEWFIVPLPIIENAVKYIIAQKTISYNAKEQMLEEHQLRNGANNIDTSGLKLLSLNVPETTIKEIVNKNRTTIEKKIKVSNADKFTYLDIADNKRWLIKYDAIKLIANKGADRKVAIVAISDISYDRDNNSVVYLLGETIAAD